MADERPERWVLTLTFREGTTKEDAEAYARELGGDGFADERLRLERIGPPRHVGVDRLTAKAWQVLDAYVRAASAAQRSPVHGAELSDRNAYHAHSAWARARQCQPMSDSGHRTRRAELVRLGFLEPCGKRTDTDGIRRRAHRITRAGLDWYRNNRDRFDAAT